ncbi:hypothetical protein PILCRDRAFT_818536 [Piloderma croceum F 1598]|uniref:Uncharacterized protein n=1 Tax=Piloderma croceum (strain F 1598) TaxID=765440 RepID=A0A0C3G0L4_PILCF|nr:hypothetical protein PILCRDRAFT_818536 [Piloderma croceum F 1598]
MHALHTVRVVLLGVVVLFSVIVLALAAALINTTESLGFYYVFSALALAVSILTLLTVGLLLVFDHIRTGFVTSRIVVELIVLGILSILWLATAADTASFNSFAVGCGADSCWSCPSQHHDVNSNHDAACGEIQAIEAFSFLNWIILMGYCITLLAFSIIHSRRGNNGVWHSSVKETNFSSRGGGIV